MALIVKISNFKIKISGYNKSTFVMELIKTVLDGFEVTANSYDFEMMIVDRLAGRDQCFKFEKFKDILFCDNVDSIYFNTIETQAVISWINGTMLITMSEEITESKRSILLIEQLKLLISLLVIQKGGFLCHCSAVKKKDFGGIVFSGPSGAGKSTIAKLLSSSCTVLNEEFNILMPNNGNWSIYSTPFCNPFSFPERSKGDAPLKAIFFLNKCSTTRVESMPFRRKFVSIMESAYFFSTERTGEAVLTATEMIISSVLVKKLHFAISPELEKIISMKETYDN
jgi:hypothetical protein